MKKRNLINCLMVSLLVVLFVVGCGKSKEIQDVSSGSEASLQTETSEQSKDVTESAVVTPQEKAPEKQEVASVIVKSENNLSDSEKKEIIDQLSKEVDELLTEINEEE